MIRAVLFDLGDTLIHERVDDDVTLDRMTLHARPHAKETLELLAGRYMLGIVSDTETSSEEDVRAALRKLGLERFISVVVTSTDMGFTKPDPRIFREALDRLGVQPDEAVMVGNDPARDIAGARELGLKTIFYRPSRYHREGEPVDADHGVDRLDEVPPILAAMDSPGTRSAQGEDEDLRTGYSVAVQMAVYDGQLSWQLTAIFVQLGILMVAGAVFPSFVGSDDSLVLALAGFAVAVAGLVMTSMFGSMVRRVRTYEEYWVLRATELEAWLADRVATFEGARTLARDKRITVGADAVKLPRMAAVKSKQMLLALFLCFFLAFLGLAAMNVWRTIVALQAAPG